MDHVHNQDIIHCDVKSLRLWNIGSVGRDEHDIIGGLPVCMSPKQFMVWPHMSADFDY
jgi:hypothetical protein